MPAVQETLIMPVVASEHRSIRNLDLLKNNLCIFFAFPRGKLSISYNLYGHKELATWSESIQSKIEFLRRASPDALLSQNGKPFKVLRSSTNRTPTMLPICFHQGHVAFVSPVSDLGNVRFPRVPTFAPGIGPWLSWTATAWNTMV